MKALDMTCPTCKKVHHIFKNSMLGHVRFAVCGQAYHTYGGPIPPVDSLITSRGVQITRCLPVRDLSPLECRVLMVHCHDTYFDQPAKNMRRRAYLLRASGPDWHLYFNESERQAVKEWMNNEKPLLEIKKHGIRN